MGAMGREATRQQKAGRAFTMKILFMTTPSRRLGGDRGRGSLLLVFALAVTSRIFRTLRDLTGASAPWPPPDFPVKSGIRPYSPSSGGEGDNRCAVYLAPSSVADHDDRPAGFGVFAAKPMAKGEYVFPRGTGPVVLITDIVRNNRGRAPSFADSIFMPKCIGFGIESDQADLEGPWPDRANKACYKSNNNCGSLTNFHPVLINVKVDDTDGYRDNLFSRFKDVGVGAFSYHTGERWHATRRVEAGEELFNDYGEDWFFDYVLWDDDRRIPRAENYHQAARLIKRFVDWCGSKGRTIGREELDLLSGWLARQPDTVTNFTSARQLDRIDNFTKRLSPERVDNSTKQLIDLVASDIDTFSRLIDSSKEYHGNASSHWRFTRSIGMSTILSRDVDWIRENGRCLDNIYPRRSTLPQAGQGGFAARPMMKGEVIVPVPTMIQVTDREDLNVRKHYKIGNKTYIGTAPYTKQLLINYCFGHDDSPMLLCPATNANLINHCSTRMKDRVGQCDPAAGPNAVLRWATDFDPETSEWLTQDLDTIDDRIHDARRGLSLEVVALRGIGADEEIFIDYGRSWEGAWERHVAATEPSPDDGSFVPVSDMNLDVGRHLLTRAEVAAGAAYLHPGVRIGCRVQGSYHPCEIVLRGVNSASYSVSVRRWRGEGVDAGDFDYEWPFEDDAAVVADIPGKDIKFFAGSFSSDQHLLGTFRHHIGVPEGMWPDQWINVTKSGDN